MFRIAHWRKVLLSCMNGLLQQHNFNVVDFSLLLVDVMTIADEDDWPALAMRS
jgi:hypothetical protein